jgi:hypothetical protein
MRTTAVDTSGSLFRLSLSYGMEVHSIVCGTKAQPFEVELFRPL